MSETAPVIADHPAASRYEATLDQQVIGFADYRLEGKTIAFVHTEVDPAYGGRGIATAIIERSLADARARGLTVRPICPLYVRYFERHPGVADLLG